jgi:uncharacterized protein YndB with AHSA1/START domain
MTSSLTHKAEGKTLTLERTFDAPRELVFSMWADGEKLKEWWIPGPGWTLEVSKMDFRVGGKWHYMMKGPDDGSEYANMESWGIMTYLEIEPPAKIVWEDAFSDVSGAVTNEFPGSTSILELFEENGKTRIVNTSTWENEAALEQVIQMGMIEGVTATFDNLDMALAKAQAM